MIIHSINLKNWRQHADTTVLLQRGLTGIIGPNGSGKTTLLEAVAWAFYGAEAVRGTMSTVRWHGAPKMHKASVKASFTVANQLYVLTRSEVEAKLEWSTLADDFETIASTPTAVTNHMRALLGLSYAEFAASYLAAQKDVMRLQQMGPEERRRFMRQVLGVGRLDEGVTAARESANALEKDALRARAEIGAREPKVEALHAAREAVAFAEAAHGHAVGAEERARLRCDAAQGLAEASDRTKAEHDRLTRAMQDAEREATAAQREVERLTAELAECEAASARLDEAEPHIARLGGLRTERDALLASRGAAQQRAFLQEAIRTSRASLETARAVVAAVDRGAYERDLTGLMQCRKALEDAQRDRERHRHDLESELRTTAAECRRTRERIDALTSAPDATCPTCLRALGEQLRPVVDGMGNEVDALTARMGDLQARLGAVQPTSADRAVDERCRDLAARVERHQDRQRAADAAARSLEQDAARLEADEARLAALPAPPATTDPPERLLMVEREIMRLEALDRAAAEDRVKVWRADKFYEERFQAQGRVDAAQLEAVRHEHLRTRLAFDPAAHARLLADVEAARVAREDARAARERAEAKLQAAEGHAQLEREVLEAYDRLAAAAAERAETWRVEARAAERLAALRTAFVQTIRPELQELVSGFVSTLTDGRYESAEIDKDFGVKLYRGGIGVDVASGGEEDVVAIALRLATSLMIADRAGHALQCVILDEPFGSLDVVRRRNVLELLTNRLKGLFEQVIVISHFEDVEQAVEHAIVVEYDEARATSAVRT